MTLEQISVTACPTCGALAQHLAGEPPTWRHVETTDSCGPRPYCDTHPPTEPGVYYMENCDIHGNPLPGLMYLHPGETCKAGSIPTKYFGPIPGAMQPWPMVPVEPDAAK